MDMWKTVLEMFVIAITFIAVGICGAAIAFTRHWADYLTCLIFSMAIGIFVLLKLVNFI
jgi:uncharacterized membrane protein